MGVIIRQGFKSTVSNYIGVVIGFVSSMYLFPKIFTPEELGVYNLFIELGTVLSAFALMGTHYSINRFFPYFRTHDQKHHGFFFWAFLLPIAGFIILNLILGIWGTEIFRFLNPKAMQYREYYHLLMLLVFIILFQYVFDFTCANHGRVAVPNFLKEVLLRIMIAVSVIFYYFKFISFYQTLFLIVLCYLVATAGSGFFLTRLTTINLKPDFNFFRNHPKLKTEILSYTFYLFISGILGVIIPKLDFFSVSTLKSDFALLAVYSIGFKLATFIEIPKRTILQIATPVISNHMKNHEIDKVGVLIKKNGTNQFILSGFMFLIIWANIDNMYELMPNGSFFVQGKWVVFYIGIAKIIDSIFSGNSPIIANSKFYSWSMTTLIIAAVSGVYLNYFFIDKWGLTGGAISTIFVALIINAVNFTLVFYKLRINALHRSQITILAILTLFISLTFTGKWLNHPILDATIKTGILGIAFVICIYKTKVSPEFNDTLKEKLKGLRLRKKQ